MKLIKTISLFYLISISIQGCSSDTGKSKGAITRILREFDSHQIVAIGESHGWKEESEFIFELISKPSFSKKVNDIVVECGNAGSQSLMDDYINGKDVPVTELQQVWRNMTVLCTCDAPIYEQLFKTIRAVNQKSDPQYKIRVLLGEPPIDWKKINKREDLGSWIFRRDEHYANVVEKEVLDKNRKALLIMGSLHFIKKGWGVDPQVVNNAPVSFDNSGSYTTSGGTFMMPVTDSAKEKTVKLKARESQRFNKPVLNEPVPNVCQILEQKYPGKLFIILPYDGYGDSDTNKEIEEKLNISKKSFILTTGNIWIGNIEAGRLFGRKSLSLTDGKITGEVIYNPYPNLKISDLCDAFLYISDRENMTRSVPADIFSDTTYLKELNRRSKIISGNSFRLNDYTDTSLKLHKTQ